MFLADCGAHLPEIHLGSVREVIRKNGICATYRAECLREMQRSCLSSTCFNRIPFCYGMVRATRRDFVDKRDAR